MIVPGMVLEWGPYAVLFRPDKKYISLSSGVLAKVGAAGGILFLFFITIYRTATT